MYKTDLSIEIVSSENKKLSSMSDPSRRAIQAILSRYYTNVKITLLSTKNDLDALVQRQPDLVFLGMKFLPVHTQGNTRKVLLSNFLEQKGIQTTGSSGYAHQKELNKDIAKECVLKAGLNTSPFMVMRGKQVVKRHGSLSYPLFVKPVNRGGGLGIDEDSIVYTKEELVCKTNKILDEYQSNSLVEQFLPGREFSVALLEDSPGGGLQAMPIELVASGSGSSESILSQAEKRANTEIVLPMNIGALRDKVTSLAVQAFSAIDGRDYGRIDIRLDASGEPQFLEANLIPSLIKGYGSFPKACKFHDVSYESMLMNIVGLGCKRIFTERQPNSTYFVSILA